MQGLAATVNDHFGIEPVALHEMVGSSQRLWRADTRDGWFVVKEFPYDPSLEGKRRAARFEYEVWESGAVLMPEPIPARDGQLIVEAMGSRGIELGVRVHRWVGGQSPVGYGADVVTRAGQLLRTIQDAGAGFAEPAPTTLHWWVGDPAVVLPNLDIKVDLGRALALLDRAERACPMGTFSHADHKPQNALLVDDALAVIDWDECGYVAARTEAVESALRWSAVDGVPERTRFRALFDGYGDVGSLEDIDFAKWIGALIGWATFQGRRALGDYDDTEQERADALSMVRQSLDELATSLNSLAEWASWVG